MEAGDDVVVGEVDLPELRRRLGDRRRSRRLRWRGARSSRPAKSTSTQLVAVQREDVAVLRARAAPRSGSRRRARAAPARRRMTISTPRPSSAGSNSASCAGRAADDHALDARLPRAGRSARRAAACRRPRRATSAGRRSRRPSARPCRRRGRSPPSRPSRRPRARPMPSTVNRPRAASPGRACCARRSGPASASSARRRAQSTSASCGHSVTSTTASAPARASSMVARLSTPCRSRAVDDGIPGARRLPPRPAAGPARTRLGASRMSSVCGLKASPSSATFLSRSEPRWLVELPDHAPLLQLVHLDHRVEELEVVAGVRCQLF